MAKRKVKRERFATAAKRIAKTEAAKPIAAPQIGDRVKTLREKYEPMIGINIPAGVQGEIINIEPFPLMQGTLIEIKLDQHHDDLVEFGNVLQFVTEGDETVADYVAIEG